MPNIFDFCWGNLDFDQISNMTNKETKVRNIGRLYQLK